MIGAPRVVSLGGLGATIDLVGLGVDIGCAGEPEEEGKEARKTGRGGRREGRSSLGIFSKRNEECSPPGIRAKIQRVSSTKSFLKKL